MVSASDRVYYQGKPLDRLTYERLRSLNMLVRSSRFGGEKSDITLVQGIGGAAASGGTHATGGAWDITAYNQKNRVLGGRLLGGADWYRPTLSGVWSAHIHGVTAGAGYAAPLARQQVSAYYAGRNGLANNGADTGPRLKTRPLFVAPWTDRGKRGIYYARKDQIMRSEGSSLTTNRGTLTKGSKFTVIAVVNVGGVLWAMNTQGNHVKKENLTMTKPVTPTPTTPLRVGTFNFPDATKITTATEAERIARAVSQIKSANLQIVGIQEGVGRVKKVDPEGNITYVASSLMTRLKTALGTDWELIVPTTNYNENYFLKRKSIPHKQHNDVIFYGYVDGVKLPGRHMSLATFTTSIGAVTIGNTHLVSSNRPGAEVQAGLAGGALSSHAGKKVMLGDFNTSGPLTGFTKAGLVDSRTIAKAISNKDAATHTNQTKTRPSTDPTWRIDGFWVGGGVAVNGYNVILDLNPDGTFVQKRASDHSLVIVSLS